MLFGLQAGAQIEAAKIAGAHARLQRRMEDDPAVTTMQPGGVTKLPATPFVFGQGGQRLTPDMIAQRSRMAQGMIASGMDTSPVGSWTQGAARVAQALVGNIQQGRLDKATARNAADSQAAASSLGKGVNIAAILANPYVDEGVKDAAKLQWQADHKNPVQPHYWETNNGSLGMIGSDGKPVIAYQDPDAKMNFIPDGMGGGNWVAVPSTAAGSAPALTAGGMPPPPTAPVGKITPIGGGAPSRGGATFR
jgi:hypothetical protein